MDEALQANWNAVVRPGDLVYHLGDFCYSKSGKHAADYLKPLNGRIILVSGSHDRQTDLEAFDEHASYMEIAVNGTRLCLCHYAMRVWHGSHHGSVHAYGHTHGRLPPLGRSMDVGVDTNNFWPYPLEEVVQRLLALEISTAGLNTMESDFAQD